MVAAVAAVVGLIPGPALATGSATRIAPRALVPAPSTAPGTGIPAERFSSPASASRHSMVPRVSARVAAGLPRTASDTTIYAQTKGNCSRETGNGSSAAPFCLLKDAVNAAAAGDTIVLLGGGPTDYSLVITKSDLTIVGEPVDGLIPAITGVTGPMLTLDGVHDVNISNLEVLGSLAIEDSTDVTFDSGYAEGIRNSTNTGPMPAVTVDGGSSGITISRTMLVDTNLTEEQGISVASGASDITVAGDAFRASDLAASGVTGLNVVDSTFQRGCFGGVEVSDSTGVSIENNVFEDADPTTNAVNGGYPASCTYPLWLADVNVSGTAGSAVSDYNDFLLPAADNTSPYSWFGTDYATVGAFQTGTGQGAHDLDDATAFAPVDVDEGPNNSGLVDLAPPADSPAVGSANPDAPGQLTSDFFGVSPYTSRGAMQYVVGNPNLAVGLSGESDLARGMTVDYAVTTEPDRALTVTIDWGDGAVLSVPIAATAQSTVAGTAQHEYAALGQYAVKVTVSDDASGDQAANTMTVSTAGSEYTPYGPVRILDTRTGLGAPEAAVGQGGTLKLQVTGAGVSGDPIPSGITAVVLNVTAVSATANSYLTVYGDEDSLGDIVTRPGTSNLNFRVGQTVPNLVVVPVGLNGVVDFYNDNGGTQVLADVAGYFTQANTSVYASMSPTRILNTRNGIGTGKVAKIPANGSITLTVAGRGGLPSTDMTAVALNLTAVDSSGDGVITAYPSDESRPTVSDVNYPTGGTVANMAVVPVHSDGTITFYNSGREPVDLIADVFGYYTTNGAVTDASAYVPFAQPERFLDTRQPGEDGPLETGALYSLPFTTSPAVTTGVFNATVVSPTGNGFFAIYPFSPDDPGAVPATSNLNYSTSQTVPNLVLGSPGAVPDPQSNAYDLGLYLGGHGTAQLILDLFGIYADA